MSRKVKHKLPAPTTCPNCGGPVKFVNNTEIYGKPYGKWPYAFLCENRVCDSYVGVHPNTRIPLGSLANKETREARSRHKPKFHSLIKVRGWSRSKGYKWLSNQLKIAPELTHWGMFDIETCNRAGEICQKELLKGLYS